MSGGCAFFTKKKLRKISANKSEKLQRWGKRTGGATLPRSATAAISRSLLLKSICLYFSGTG
jgi:hypothetical protein